MAKRDRAKRIDPRAAGVHHVLRLGVVEEIECCDCALRHREVYVPDPDDPSLIHCYSWRDEAATARARQRKG